MELKFIGYNQSTLEGEVWKVSGSGYTGFFLRECKKKLPCPFFNKDSGNCRSYIKEETAIKVEDVQLTEPINCYRDIED
jgi:hypothetical protein